MQSHISKLCPFYQELQNIFQGDVVVMPRRLSQSLIREVVPRQGQGSVTGGQPGRDVQPGAVRVSPTTATESRAGSQVAAVGGSITITARLLNPITAGHGPEANGRAVQPSIGGACALQTSPRATSEDKGHPASLLGGCRHDGWLAVWK